jgi:phage terminase large subunit-like protein
VLAREISYPAEDTRLDQYIFNAVLVQNSWGWMYDKESDGSSNQVDGADACVMARLARQDYLNLPPEKQRQPKPAAPKFFSFTDGPKGDS